MAKMIRRVKSTPQIQAIASMPGTNVERVPVEVVKETPGPVTLGQKIKGYYKGLIGLVGSTATGLIAAQGVPGLPDNFRGWFAAGTVALTVIGIILKKNEDWVDSL